MQNTRLQAVLVIAGVLALLWLGVRIFRPSPEEKNVSAAAAVEQKTAAAFAEEAVAIAGKGGAVLVVTPLFQRADQTPDSVAAFRKAAAKKGLSIASEVSWPPPPSDEERQDSISLVHHLVTQRSLTADWLADEAARHPEAKAVVSLVGEPVVREGDEERCRGRFPPVLCVARENARTAALVRAGVVRMALMTTTKAVTCEPGRWLFDEIYRKVTPETLDAWQKDQDAGR